MPSEPAIQRVSVEAFRGFRDRFEFEVAATAVLFSGPNGTGKTSFFDAIQWALTGRLQRLETLRSRRNIEHVVNVWRAGERASVEMDLVISGLSLAMRRRGDHADSTLELSLDGATAVYAEEAERQLSDILTTGPGVSLEMALMTSGIMQQDVMRHVLEAKPSERYAHISSVLGLGSLEDFEEQAAEVSKAATNRISAARAERDEAARRLESGRVNKEQAERRLRSKPSAEVVARRLTSLLDSPPSGITVSIRDDLESVDGVMAALSGLQAFREHFDRVVSGDRAKRRIQDDLPEKVNPQDLEDLRQKNDLLEEEATVARAELEQATRELEAAESATRELARLAASAIPLLSDLCPVCGQSIDPDHVEQELRRKAEGSDQLIALRQSVEKSRQAVTRAEEGRLETEHALVAAEESARRWNDFEKQARDHEALTRRLETVSDSVSLSNLNQVLAEHLAVNEFIQRLESLLDEMADLFETGPESGLLERSLAEIESFEAVLAEKVERLAEMDARAQRASRLAEAAKEARQEVARERIEAILPLVTDIYSRLDPHPVFKTVELELDTYYRQGTTTPLVKDVLEGVSADPLMVMSTSQANIMALAYFLAMGWVAGDRGLPFVLLDDPLQSMDDVNVLGFSDLFRHLRTKRQLVVSTHERRFASLLLRKLTPRNDDERTIHFRLHGWDRSGPAFESEVVYPEMVEQPNLVVQRAG